MENELVKNLGRNLMNNLIFTDTNGGKVYNFYTFTLNISFNCYNFLEDIQKYCNI